ncbi:MAG TPA: hypothetical protein VIX41_10750, partial [Acidimicrobiales bacterium]
YLDPVPVAEVRRFEEELIEWFRIRHGEVLDAIRTNGDIPDVEALDAAMKDFAEQFSWEQVADETGPRAAAPSVAAEDDAESPAAATSGDGVGVATESAEEQGG